MENNKFNFEYADENDKEYIKSLNLTTFDGITILSRNFEHKTLSQSIFCDKKSKTYFFHIRLGSFSDIKTVKERQIFLKEKFKSDKAVVKEYMLVCDDMRAYIFTNVFHYQEGVRVKVLEIMHLGGRNECVSSMVKSAFKKEFSYCPEFSISMGKTTELVDYL